MLQTLFHIPHELFGLPLFGFGWALILWAVVAVVVAVQSWRRSDSQAEVFNFLLVMGVVGGLIVFVLPSLEAKSYDGQPIGLPIRGYGTFLLFAFLSGVLLAAWRASSAGLNPDSIYSLAFWMFVAGIAGARVFFVIEYWDDFRGDSSVQTIVNIFKFTEGGLVVYGSLIGALAAFVAYCYRYQLPCLAVGDVIAPSLALGLSIGRLGCLMNSCCFGGLCLEGPSIQFPQGSQPFVRQIQTGRLLGMKLERLNDGTPRQKVVEVELGGIAEKNGIQRGDYVVVQSSLGWWKEAEAKPNEKVTVAVVQRNSGSDIRLARDDLPGSSMPVHPTQLYSSFNAILLCLIVLVFHPLRTRDGQTLALLLTLYPIARYMLELIRTDEPGQFGTALTISQWVSFIVIAAAAAIWVYGFRQPKGLAKLEGLGVART